MLSAENQRWLDEFRAKHGRAPRVLHIGNIANNAYNNAKILNAANFDNDVICYDYYHIMGCPEWEDADFEGDLDDDFRPNWFALGIKNFERPSWFAQGALVTCLAYLHAKATGLSEKSSSLWVSLGKQNLTLRLRVLSNVLVDLAGVFVQSVYGGLGLQVLSARIYRLLWLMSLNNPRYLYTEVHLFFHKQIRSSFGSSLLASFATLILVPLYWVLFFSRHLVPRRFWPLWRHTLETPITSHIDNRCDELLREFRQSFPDRADQLELSDISAYFPFVRQWTSLMQTYDFVIAYSTDPFLPLLVGQDYFAFEHGTLRDIPYEQTAQGRRTSLSYRMAKHVFVTNSDCQQSAEFLAPGRHTLINHPYDEDHGMSVDGWEELRLELQSELKSDFLFFFPTRHDWVPETGYADKANDVFLRAFGQLRAEGASVGLICCSWGQNVADSQALLKDLGCSAYVRWVKPMAMVRFERMAKACDCVVDQFKLGAFGGVLFKAMAVGAPVLTYLDEHRLQEQYAEVPPVINCKTESEIIGNARTLIDNPSMLASKKHASRAWIKKYHGKDATVNAQVDQFRQTMPF